MPFTNPGLYADMALEYPNVKVIFAHLDYPVAEEAVSLAVRVPNIYLSSSLSIPAYLRLAYEAWRDEAAAGLRRCGQRNGGDRQVRGDWRDGRRY